MSTVSNSIITWLKTFDMEVHKKMKFIHTDIQPARVESYALIKEPVIKKKHYLSGREERTEHYTLMARFPSKTDPECVDNTEWGENLENWVEEQNRQGNFPVIEGAKVQNISVTTPFYMGKSDINESVYQLTISIKYMKEI